MAINRKVRGIRGSIPPGYIVGRATGTGAPQLIKMTDLQTQITASAPGSTLATPVSVANGGTGLASGTSGGIPAYTGSTTITSSGVLAANHLVIGGGAGATPSTEADWTVSSHVLTGNLNSASPAAPLSDTIMQLSGQDGHTVRVILDGYNNGAPGQPNLIYRSSAGTAASPSALQSGDTMGKVSFFGYGSTGYSSSQRASYSGYTTETWTDAHQGAAIKYIGTQVGTTTTVQMAALTTEGCSYQGTTTNDSAAAGFVGEDVNSIVLIGSEVSLTTGTTADVTSTTLTPGHWIIWGEIWLDLNAATTVSILAGGLNTTSATLPTAPAAATALAQQFPAGTTGSKLVMPVGPCEAKLASNTTYYLSTNATFAVNTAKAYGKLFAMRAR